MPVNIAANISDLEPHLSNPRLRHSAETPQAMYRLLAREDPSGLVKLAESVASKPWDGSTLMMLTTESGNPAFGPYTVREGNRRLTALRGLESPDMFEGVLGAAEMARLRSASSRATLPATVPAMVFGSDEEEDLKDRIERRHGGEGDGVGVRSWDVRARTRALGGQDSVAVALLDFADDDGNYGDTSNVGITTLSRIVGTPEVRAALGIEVVRGRLAPMNSSFSPSALRRLLDFMHEPDFTVDKVRKLDQRRSLATDILSHRSPAQNPDDADVDDQLNPASTPPAPSPAPSPVPPAPASPRPSPPRNTLVPKNFPEGTGNARINDIIKQAKKLKIDELPAVGGIALRVVLELIVDEYRSRLTPPGNERQKLREKTLAVALELETRGLLTHQEKNAVEHVCNSPNYGITTIKTLHSYVHGLHAPVNVNDVREHWDALDKFLRTAWTNLP